MKHLFLTLLAAAVFSGAYCQSEYIPNDRYFSYDPLNEISCDEGFSINPFQWNLKDTGANPADINVTKAWTITQGSPDIKIAVVNDGVMERHPDLKSNILAFEGFNASIPSYNANSRAGRPYYYPDWWGTAIAGIIAAKSDNDTGMVGVAPNCKIIPISVIRDQYPYSLFRNFINPEDLANGIDWAWRNGADVIDLTWSYPLSALTPSQIDSITRAIDSATTKGRNGLGCVVISSAGLFDIYDSYTTANNVGSENTVYFPASLPNVISVGSMNHNQKRIAGTNYGTMLDLVAPGDSIFATAYDFSSFSYADDECLLLTHYGGTDQEYRPYSGIEVYKDGTIGEDVGIAVATPQVSGVAALMLSVNNCLTWQEVKTMLESSASKVGGYNYVNTNGRPNGAWNEEMGYGKLNAYGAVVLAQQSLAQPIVHLQNQTISTGAQNFNAVDDIFVGNNVDPGSPSGNVVINGNANVHFRAGNTINFEVGTDISPILSGFVSAQIDEVVATSTNCTPSPPSSRESVADYAQEEIDNNLALNVQESSIGGFLSLTPNPTTSAAMLQYSLEEATEVSINVFNYNGAEISALAQPTNYQKAGNHQVLLDLTNLPAGIYYLKVNLGEKAITKKMVKL